MNDEFYGEGGSSRAEQFWEGHYREHEQLWSGKANAVLVDVVGSLPVGTALDLGCGEGGIRSGWPASAGT